jgi:GTPase SAR1 family protein
MEKRQYNLSVLGSGGCGRRSIVYQAIHHHFITDYDPTGEDSFRKPLTVDDQQIIIDLMVIWSTEYVSLVTHMLSTTDATLLVYASNDRQSFEEIRKFYDLICQIKERDDPPVVLVETKVDLPNERQVTIEEGVQLAKELKAAFFSTSAKENVNIEECILHLATIAYRDHNTQYVTGNKGKKLQVIPQSRHKIEEVPSTMRGDIKKYLFDNQQYSDLMIICNKSPIHVHKPILVSRWASFMELIKPNETSIELDAKYTLRAMLDLFNYVYTGKFEGDVSEDLRAAIMKWEVYTLLPVLKGEKVDGFFPSFDRLFNLEFMSDIKITFKADNQRAIFAHRAVLCARSEYFRAMFKAGFKESTSSVLEIDDCDYDTYFTLLKYYYLDKLEINPNNFIPLLAISHRYNDKAVLQTIEKFMQDHLTIENVCHVLSLAELYNLSDLKLNCEFFIAYRFEKVAKTSAFKKLPQEMKTALEAKKKPGDFLIEKDKEDPLIKQIKSLKL